MRNGILGALAALMVGGCGLVLDLGPDDEPGAPPRDGGIGRGDGGGMRDGGPAPDSGGLDAGDGDAGDGDAGASDAGDRDASIVADAAVDACVPVREVCNGVDDNCDGVIDEGCCARYVLSGADGTGLSPDSPVATIQGAIASMATAGETGDVCVAATASGAGGCTRTTYTEGVTMAEGVSVLGGFRPDPGRWDRTDASCETVIHATSDVGVLFGHSVTRATRLDGFTVVGLSGVTQSAAITVQAGATISGNRIYGGSTESRAYGVRLEACGTEAADIIGNAKIVGTREGTAEGFAVAASECMPTIERNGTIAGRDGGSGDAWGVLCEGGSTCTVVGNGSIVGIESPATGGWGRAVSLRDSATGEVARNERISGCTGSASWCIGVLVTDAPGTPLVDRNVVEPARGSSWTSGILVRRANATVSNNLVVVDGGNGIELALNRPSGSTTEATVHSNTVVAPASPSSSRTVRLLLADYEGPDSMPPNGIFRNNIAACLGTGSSRVSFTELGSSGKPRIFENNDLWGCGGMYQISSGALLSSITGVDALPGAGGNMSVDPGFVSPPTNYHLGGTSMLIDAGTSSGTVPPEDFDGEARPRGSGPDVGYDEAG